MASLADLFRGRSHSSSTTSCSAPIHRRRPACSAVADGFNGFAVHLENHDVAMIAAHVPQSLHSRPTKPHGLDVHVGLVVE